MSKHHGPNGNWIKNNNMLSIVFLSIYKIACQKLAFESQQGMPMEAASLCPTICVCDIMNKASLRSTSRSITSWAKLFSSPLVKMAAPQEAQKQNSTSLAFWQNHCIKHENQNIRTLSTFSGQLASSQGVPFNRTSFLTFGVKKSSITLFQYSVVTKQTSLLQIKLCKQAQW